MSITTKVASSNPAQARCTRCCIMWSSLHRSVVFSRYLPPRYNWNIVESDIKHQKIKKIVQIIILPRNASISIWIFFLPSCECQYLVCPRRLSFPFGLFRYTCDMEADLKKNFCANKLFGLFKLYLWWKKTPKCTSYRRKYPIVPLMEENTQ